MNKLKFTKGEWRLPHFVTAKKPNDCTCKFILNEQYCGCIATIHGDDGDLSLEEAKANAHLICAAPNLFEACVQVVHDYEVDGMKNMQTRNYAFYEICKKAIMKAMGETAK